MSSKPKQEELRKAFVEQLKVINVKADPDSLFIDECLELVNLEVTSVLDEVSAVNEKGMFIDPSKTSAALVAEHRIDVMAAIQSIRSRYE